MYRSPGFIVPSSFPDKESLLKKLREQNDVAGFKPFDEKELAHSQGAELLENVLAHHGTKGMKWGIRGKRSSTPSHPASEDHTTVQAHQTKAKEGGVKSLSNKELQDIITRKNLEKQHSELAGAGKTFDKGHKHIKKILSAVKTLNDIHGTIDTTAKVVKKVATS